jgi:hypothetical protein
MLQINVTILLDPTHHMHTGNHGTVVNEISIDKIHENVVSTF